LERDVYAPSDAAPSVALHVAPGEDGNILRGDLLVAEIVQANAWHRPLAQYAAASPAAIPALASFARLEGLFWRFVPEVDPPFDREAVRTALLRTYVYRGYANPSISLDLTDREIASIYFIPLKALVHADAAAGDFEACARARDLMLKWLPPARLGLDSAQTRDRIGECNGNGNGSRVKVLAPR